MGDSGRITKCDRLIYQHQLNERLRALTRTQWVWVNRLYGESLLARCRALMTIFRVLSIKNKKFSCAVDIISIWLIPILGRRCDCTFYWQPLTLQSTVISSLSYSSVEWTDIMVISICYLSFLQWQQEIHCLIGILKWLIEYFQRVNFNLILTVCI
jgi:hypothetical protein